MGFSFSSQDSERERSKQRKHLLLGEPNLAVTNIESGDDVLEEDITDDPVVVGNVTGHDATNTFGRALLNGTKVEELGVNSEAGACKGEGDGGNGVARNGENALAEVISGLGAGDGLVELGDGLAVTHNLDEKEKNSSDLRPIQGVERTYEGRAGVDDSSHLLKRSLATDGDRVHIDRPESLLGYRSEYKVAVAALDTTECKLCPALRELEGENRLRDRVLRNQTLEEGRSIEYGDALESHTHQPIRLEVVGGEARRVLFGGTDGLLRSGETGNGNGVGEDLARDGRSVTECGVELFAGVLGVGGLGRVVDGVAGAGVATVGAGEKEIGAAGIKIDCGKGEME
jgi:hypothetical protein